jgi:hypothetical protein
MTAACPECCAPLEGGGACIDHFHALLLLEAEAAADPAENAGGRGAVAHFYAVSSYVLQHPEGMGYTAAALAGARRNLADHLAGRVPLAELLAKVRRAADGAARVIRRAGEPIPRWRVGRWPMTVADVLAGGARGYGQRVAAWAESVLRTLDE